MIWDVEALGNPNRDTLAHPPLELVVCQIRHEPIAGGVSPSHVLGVQSLLGFGFDKLSSAPPAGVTFAAAPSGEFQPHVTQSPSWQLTTSDGSWIATFNADSFALECTSYTTWTDFADRLQGVIDAVAGTYAPQVVQRVGVRTIDRIWRRGSTIPREWVGLLDPGVLGFAGNDVLKDSVQVTQTYQELAFGETRANVRGSIASDQTPSKYSFLLDIDCFDERARIFDKSSILELVKGLHFLGLKMFQSVLTDRLYEELRG